MKRALLSLILAAGLRAQILPPNSSPPGPVPTSGSSNTIDVTRAPYNAKCDSVTDDRLAFQKAINQANANWRRTGKLWTVTMPGRTCIMGSSVNPDSLVQRNLDLLSGVTIQGIPGQSKLLQTAAGRVSRRGNFNVVINVGVFFPTFKAFTNVYYNLAANPTLGSNTITLANAADAAHFNTGDYVAYYYRASQSPDDVQPQNESQLSQVNKATGVLTLVNPVGIPFVVNGFIPAVENVSAQGLGNYHAGISGIIVQGQNPIFITEVFYFTAKNCQFLTDVSASGPKVPEMNTVMNSTFDSNVWDTVNGSLLTISAELPQRGSSYNTWTNNTFGSPTSGFGSWGEGEFNAGNTFSGNHIYANAVPGGPLCAFEPMGNNITFAGNDVRVTGNWNHVNGAIICDYEDAVVANPPSRTNNYYNGVQGVTISNNTITNCSADGNGCITVFGNGTHVTGNTINVLAGSSAHGVLVNGTFCVGGCAQTTQVNGNIINTAGGVGVSLAVGNADSWTINGNTFNNSAGGGTGIVIQGGSPSNGGSGCQIQNNTSGTGIGTILSRTPTNHPACTASNNR